MNQKINISLLFIVLTGIVGAQNNTCLKDVQRVYKTWKEEVGEIKENTIYLKYVNEINIKEDDELTKNSTTIELISNKNNSTFLTNSLKVYQDKKHTVSILSDKKMVVINEYVGDAYKQEKIGGFEVLQDTIFSHLVVQECKEVVINELTYKQVVLKATPYGAKLFNIKTIQFLLDEQRNRVKEISVVYMEGHRFHSMKIKIVEQNLNYNQAKLTNVAITKVLDSKGSLLTQYKGYRLIDNRK